MASQKHNQYNHSILISLPGGSVGGPASKKNIKGKAKGLPKNQITSLMYSMTGLITSNPSAHPAKHISQPHPLFQQSQQALLIKPSIWAPASPVPPNIRPAMMNNEY